MIAIAVLAHKDASPRCATLLRFWHFCLTSVHRSTGAVAILSQRWGWPRGQRVRAGARTVKERSGQRRGERENRENKVETSHHCVEL